jgi:cobalt-zinc-cadmium efflux system membrane fusion protein
VDEETRTATARIVLPNTKKRWRPGMFVTGRVVVDRTKVPLAVPVAALQTIADQPVVFVETDAGFQQRSVTTGRADDHHVEIRSGLAPGERYVSQEGFTLKAELSREQFGDGHGH